MTTGTIFLFVGILWVGSELLLVVFRRSGEGGKSHDAGSLLRLNAVIYGSVAAAIGVSISGLGMIRGAGLTLAWSGLALILLGLALRWTAILTLRRYFTVNVAIQTDHQIVRTGLYGYIRHPAYAGTILSFAGLGMAFGNWIALAVLLTAIPAAFMARIRIEERAMAGEFKAAYDVYRGETWRLIPWVY
jgi:protein-S-isoprenylcysteine O-methyltransferase Ste14